MNDNRCNGLTIKICKTGNKYKYYYAYHDAPDWNEVSERSKLRYDLRLIKPDLINDSHFLVKSLAEDFGIREETTTILIDCSDEELIYFMQAVTAIDSAIEVKQYMETEDIPEDPQKEKKNKDKAELLVKEGYKYFIGDQVKIDLEKAKSYFSKAMDLGSSEAKYYMGYLLLREHDYIRGEQLIREAAESGNLNAMAYLADEYKKGIILKKDSRLALQLYTEIVNRGSRLYIWDIADIYIENKDYKTAIRWYEKLCECDDGEYECAIGHLYENGIGVAKDLFKAEALYLMAKKKGHERAKIKCESLRGIMPGFPNGCYGRFYSRNTLTGTDVLKSFWEDYYTRAGRYCYSEEIPLEPETEKGIEAYKNEDYGIAFKYFMRAGEKEDAVAQTYLGDCFYFGIGTEQNRSLAYEWYKRAADQGYSDAQYKIGEYFTPVLSTEQERWMEKAARNGDFLARSWLS